MDNETTNPVFISVDVSLDPCDIHPHGDAWVTDPRTGHYEQWHYAKCNTHDSTWVQHSGAETKQCPAVYSAMLTVEGLASVVRKVRNDANDPRRESE